MLNFFFLNISGPTFRYLVAVLNYFFVLSYRGTLRLCVQQMTSWTFFHSVNMFCRCIDFKSKLGIFLVHFWLTNSWPCSPRSRSLQAETISSAQTLWQSHKRFHVQLPAVQLCTLCTERSGVRCEATLLPRTDKQLVMAVNHEPFFLPRQSSTHHALWLLITHVHIFQAHVHTLAPHMACSAPFPGLMGNRRDGKAPWQRECWPLPVPREQLVRSGRLVSKQICSQSSRVWPLAEEEMIKKWLEAKKEKKRKKKKTKEGLQKNQLREERKLVLANLPDRWRCGAERKNSQEKKKEAAGSRRQTTAEFVLLPAVIHCCETQSN